MNSSTGPELKAFADKKINVTEKLKFVLLILEMTVYTFHLIETKCIL